MDIAVLVKQTPQVSEVKVTDKAQWPESEVIVNPFDEYAIEEALRIKERLGGKVMAISYGTEKSESALRDALALGVDEAYLIVDDDYNNLDPQRAAKALTGALNKIGNVQMVLAGKQATDDDSSVTAPMTAAILNWPQVGFVKKFESVEEDKVLCLRTTDEGHDRIEVPLPAVFSVVKEINEPRLPSLRGKLKAKKAPITKWSPSDIGVELVNSIEIKNISSPPARSSGEVLNGEKDEIIDKLISKLKENQVL